MKRDIRQLANAITMARILGVGVIFWLTPYKTSYWQLWAIAIYTIICLTDFLDGWVARKLDIVTDIGKILDPLADKILVLVFLPLLEMQVITSFPVFIILSREFAIMALRVVSAQHKAIVEAKLSGKIKTAFTLPVCGILLARVPVQDSFIPSFLLPLKLGADWVQQWPTWFINFLIWSMVLVTIWSFMDYFGSFLKNIYKKNPKKDDPFLKKYLFLLPNTVTVINLICGISAAIFGYFGYIHVAVTLVLLGIILDAIDGKVARKLNVMSKVGAALDSKADYMSFGIAPSIIIYRQLASTFTGYGTLSIVVPILVAALYYGSVHFRLKRFDKGGHSLYFEGLPSPAGAAFIVVAAVSAYFSYPPVFIALSLILSALMISKLPYPHNEAASKKVLLRHLRIPTLILMFSSMIQLMRFPLAKYSIYEMLFLTMSAYILSPLLPASRSAETTKVSS